MTASCRRPDCASPCHNSTTGRYCAPARCYCYGCPGSLGPVERGRPSTSHGVNADQLAKARAIARQAADARDLRDALAGEPIASPNGRRLSTFAGQVVAA